MAERLGLPRPAPRWLDAGVGRRCSAAWAFCGRASMWRFDARVEQVCRVGLTWWLRCCRRRRTFRTWWARRRWALRATTTAASRARTVLYSIGDGGAWAGLLGVSRDARSGLSSRPWPRQADRVAVSGVAHPPSRARGVWWWVQLGWTMQQWIDVGGRCSSGSFGSASARVALPTRVAPLTVCCPQQAVCGP